MAETIPFSKYASRSPQGVLRKTVTRTAIKPDRRQGFARVTENMLPRFNLRDQLFLSVLMRSGLASSRRNSGWVQLPDVVLQQIGLVDRSIRSRIVRRLIAEGVLETRQPDPGKALEYRVRPVSNWRRTAR
jgi:hypothetical protein